MKHSEFSQGSIMKKKHRFSLLIFLSLFSILILASPTGISFAQEPTPSDDDINTIARKLYCPVCENTPLDVCPTQACRQWREEIRLRLAQGWTDEQPIKEFVGRMRASAAVRVVEAIEAGIASGQLRPMDSHLAAEMVINQFTGLILSARLGSAPTTSQEQKEHAEAMADMLLHGLSAHPKADQ